MKGIQGFLLGLKVMTTFLMDFFNGMFSYAPRSSIPEENVSSYGQRSSIPELENHNDSIYIFHEPCNPNVEVIFFHDIHWRDYKEPHVQSWMSSSTPSVCWPQAWLSKQCPDVRILAVKYDGGVWKTDHAGRMDLFKLAENLSQDILSIYTGDRPIFLIGHGLGGLVIKKLVQTMQRRLQDNELHEKLKKGTNLGRLACFLSNIKGVFFYATPFLGSRLADSTKNCSSRSALLNPLELLSTEACRVNDWFTKWRQHRDCRAVAIFAALPTKLDFWYGRWSTVVVEEGSARYDVDDFYTCDRSDHFSVSKPASEKDSSFQMLVAFISGDVQPVTRQPSGQIEDSARSACGELEKTILSEARELRYGEEFCLYRDQLEEIGKFPEIWGSLRDGLKKAGCAEVGGDDYVESWQRVNN